MNPTSSQYFERAGLALATGLTFVVTLSACSSPASGPIEPQGSSGAAAHAGSPSDANGAGAGAGASSGGASGAGAAGLSGGATSSGGTAGTAGSAGSAESAGTSSGGAGPSLGGTGACPANAIFCADFESGSIPSAAVYSPAYQQATMATYMAVDATVAHGGSHSLKVTPAGNFSQMLNVTTGTARFWTRFYLRQDINTNTVMGHDTFVAATDPAANTGNGLDIRIGEHECQLELNRSSDDKEILSDAVSGSSNYTCAGGTVFAPNTWYCVETFYDGPNDSVRVLVDSAEVTALHVTDWGPYTYKSFKFGFENYGGTTRTLWYDDVAIAPQQIGCSTAGP